MYPIHISFSLCVACGSGQPCHFCQYVIQLIFSGSCSAGWFQGGSSCYYFSAASTVKSWDDARTFCRSQADGADLVVFGSAAEQAAVTSIHAAQGNVLYLYDYTLLQCFIVWPSVLTGVWCHFYTIPTDHHRLHAGRYIFWFSVNISATKPPNNNTSYNWFKQIWKQDGWDKFEQAFLSLAQ